VATLLVENLRLEYAMRKTQQTLLAMQGVSFLAEPGEFVAVVGPSGCGKSSLLNAIAGTLAPTGGRIVIDGTPVTGPGYMCGMVFQSPALFPWRTVVGNVAYGLELRGVPAREAASRARPFVRLVGLEGFEDSFPDELSGGMQQRANLARAMAVQPRVLLCDEPLSALDAQTREHMQAELQRVWLELRPTTVYVTHQISEALYLADRILVLSPRPSHIRASLVVDRPRPRALRGGRDPYLLEMEEHIWNLLQPDAAAALASEADPLNGKAVRPA
jgi:NitT/TauT family transport system ATP-binding protein